MKWENRWLASTARRERRTRDGQRQLRCSSRAFQMAAAAPRTHLELCTLMDAFGGVRGTLAAHSMPQ